MDTRTIPEEKIRRMGRILAEAEERFAHELLPDAERLEILARIKRLRRQLSK